VDLAVHSLRLRKLWREAEPVAPGQLPVALGSRFLTACSCTLFRAPSFRLFSGERVGSQEPDQTQSCGQRLGAGRRRVEICLTRSLDRPSVIGFFRPRILIPDWLLGRLTQQEFEQVVLHEAEHLRRRDDWTNLAQKLCLVLFPLNPALVWMERRLCREREMACDDGVVRRTRSPRAYAACLASLAERGLERRAAALSLGAWQRRPELARRVHRLLRHTPGLNSRAARALFAVLGCALVFGSFEFARCPQLVAFVSAPQPDLAATAAPAAAAAPLKTAPLAGAIAPRSLFNAARPGAASYPLVARGRKASSAAPHSADSAALTMQASAAPRQASLSAEVSSSAAPQAPQPGQQWIVLTAWEQIETTNSRASADSAQADAVQPAVAPYPLSGRIAITRLILRIVPAAPFGSANASPASMSLVPLPVAPLRDGWLVIQL
jgi:hypothetical protein